MRKSALTLLALGALVALSSCTRGSVGIFASIEQEVKTQKANLSENSAITGVAESSNYVFASIGNISRRPKNSNDWNGVGNPPGIDSPLSVALVQIGAPGSRSYYAAFNSQEGSDYGLFELTVDDTTGSVTWTELDLAYDDTNTVKEIAALIPVDTDLDGFAEELYASVRTTFLNQEPLFALLHDPAGAVSGTKSNEAILDEGIDNYFDGAVDTAGDTWFVGSKGGLVRWDGGTLTAVSGTSVAEYPEASDGTVGKGFSGVYAADVADLNGSYSGTVLFVSDKDGLIWATTDSGSNWEYGDLTSRALTDMVWVPQAGENGNGALLVGTKPVIQQAISDQGYFEVGVTVAAGPVVTPATIRAADASAYSTSDLQDATVLSFYRPDDGSGKSSNQSFILTGGIGLWNVTYGTDGIPVEVKWE